MVKAKLVAALLIALAAPLSQAQAACAASDLPGRWDVYGMQDFFGSGATLDCVFVVNARGRFARSACLARGSGEAVRTLQRGELSISRSCLVTGEISDFCEVDGTMTKNKEMISGVFKCDDDAVLLFNMVRR
jgi:hypothetical protein